MKLDINHLKEVWQAEELTRIERDIYATLFLNADPIDKSCSLSYEEISEKAKLSKKSVFTNVKSLIEKGWIAKEFQYDSENHGRLPNKYILVDSEYLERIRKERERKLKKMIELADKLGYTLHKIEE